MLAAIAAIAPGSVHTAMDKMRSAQLWQGLNSREKPEVHHYLERLMRGEPTLNEARVRGIIRNVFVMSAQLGVRYPAPDKDGDFFDKLAQRQLDLFAAQIKEVRKLNDARIEADAEAARLTSFYANRRNTHSKAYLDALLSDIEEHRQLAKDKGGKIKEIDALYFGRTLEQSGILKFGGAPAQPSFPAYNTSTPSWMEPSIDLTRISPPVEVAPNMPPAPGQIPSVRPAPESPKPLTPPRPTIKL